MCITQKRAANPTACYYYIGNGGKKQADRGKKRVDKFNFFCGKSCGKKVEEWISLHKKRRERKRRKERSGKKREVMQKNTAGYPQKSTNAQASARRNFHKFIFCKSFTF